MVIPGLGERGGRGSSSEMFIMGILWSLLRVIWVS